MRFFQSPSVPFTGSTEDSQTDAPDVWRKSRADYDQFDLLKRRWLCGKDSQIRQLRLAESD